MCSAGTAQLLTDYFSQKSRREEKTYTVIELTVSMLPEVESRKATAFVECVSTSAFATHLLVLGLEQCALDPAAFVHALNCFKNAPALELLQTLNMSHNHVGYTPLHKLKLMLHKDRAYLPSLTALNVASTSAVCAALELFEYKFLRTRPKLEALDISGNKISLIDEDVSKLLARATLTWGNLKTVDLSFNPLSDDGLVRILRIVLPLEYDPHNPNQVPEEIMLEKLNIANCEIGDSTVHHLVAHMKAKRFTKLHTLNMSMNGITHHGCEWLIDPLIDKQLPELRVLGLGMNNLGDDGMIRLANSVILGALDDIQHLDLGSVGSGLNNINYFAKCISDRDVSKNPTPLKIQSLRLYGSQPFFTKKKARLDMPEQFSGRVKVT